MTFNLLIKDIQWHKGMVTLGQDYIQLNIWICSCMKENCIMLGIFITWLLFCCRHMKIQLCVKMPRDRIGFWVLILKYKQKSLVPGMVLHAFKPTIHGTESCRSLRSR